MTQTALSEAIERHRRNLGPSLTIVGHHYQAEDVIRHTDLRGDSLELARKSAELDAAYLVFCGVYFMGESAALLAKEGCDVYLPAPSAECSMALMSPAPSLERVMRDLTADGRTIIPLAYVNSTLAVKAVVGRYGGAVCTSANARVMLEWAFAQGDAVVFLPDKNLGQNTADALGIPQDERVLLALDDLGLISNMDAAKKAGLLLWPGYCCYHDDFTVAMIDRMRSDHPGAKVIVHPECRPEVVAAADAAGSTSFIIRYVQEAPQGSTVVIGTEINLVKRLAREHAGRVTILPLAESLCEHMAEVTEEALARALDALDPLDEAKARGYRVTIDPELKEPAKAALERMLRACA